MTMFLHYDSSRTSSQLKKFKNSVSHREVETGTPNIFSFMFSCFPCPSRKRYYEYKRNCVRTSYSGVEVRIVIVVYNYQGEGISSKLRISHCDLWRGDCELRVVNGCRLFFLYF